MAEWWCVAAAATVGQTWVSSLVCTCWIVEQLEPSVFLIFHGATAPNGSGPPHYRFFTPTLNRITLGNSPPDEWSARRRDIYLTTHNTYERQISMLAAAIEPTSPTSKRLQTHALDSAIPQSLFRTNVWNIWFYPKHKRLGHFEFEKMCRNLSKPLHRHC
jgi:hypothetical protein